MSFKELSIMSDKKGTVLFYPYIPKKSLKILKKTLSTRWIGQGPMVDKFEKKFSDIFLDGKECVSTGSGTDALHLAYLLEGIKKLTVSPASILPLPFPLGSSTVTFSISSNGA